MSFVIGQRVGYVNLSCINLGWVRSVVEGGYLVEWDDGWDPDPEFGLSDGVFTDSELLEVH